MEKMLVNLGFIIENENKQSLEYMIYEKACQEIWIMIKDNPILNNLRIILLAIMGI